MSRLQSFLRALPPNSLYTSDLQSDQRCIHASMDGDAAREIERAKLIQFHSNCGWSDALVLARSKVLD